MQDQQRCQPEGGSTNRDDRDHADQLIGPTITVERGDDSEGEGNKNGNDQTEECQLQGERKCLGNLVADAIAGTDTVCSKVTVEHPPQVEAVLDEEGLIEVVLNAVFLKSIRGCCLAERRVGGINGRQPHN